MELNGVNLCAQTIWAPYSRIAIYYWLKEVLVFSYILHLFGFVHDLILFDSTPYVIGLIHKSIGEDMLTPFHWTMDTKEYGN